MIKGGGFSASPTLPGRMMSRGFNGRVTWSGVVAGKGLTLPMLRLLSSKAQECKNL